MVTQPKKATSSSPNINNEEHTKRSTARLIAKGMTPSVTPIIIRAVTRTTLKIKQDQAKLNLYNATGVVVEVDGTARLMSQTTKATNGERQQRHSYRFLGSMADSSSTSHAYGPPLLAGKKVTARRRQPAHMKKGYSASQPRVLDGTYDSLVAFVSPAEEVGSERLLVGLWNGMVRILRLINGPIKST